MAALSVKAITIGALIDVGGSMAVGMVYALVYGILLASTGATPEQMQQTMLADPTYFAVTGLVGLVFVATGGYVAGRIARAREVVHGGAVGIVAVVVGLLFMPTVDIADFPAWYLPTSFGLTIPLGLVGGYLAWRRTGASVS